MSEERDSTVIYFFAEFCSSAWNDLRDCPLAWSRMCIRTSTPTANYFIGQCGHGISAVRAWAHVRRYGGLGTRCQYLCLDSWF